MPRSKTRPPLPNERPVALAVGGAPSLRAPRPERLPLVPTFDGPRQTKATGAGRADTIGLAVFMVLIVLGLLAAARAFLVM